VLGDNTIAGGGVRARGGGEAGGVEKTAANAKKLAAAGLGGDTTPKEPRRCCTGETAAPEATTSAGGGLLRFGGGVRASGGGDGGGEENLAARAATLPPRRVSGDGNKLVGTPRPGESGATVGGSAAARVAGAGTICSGDAACTAAAPCERTGALRAPADANEADTFDGTKLASGNCLAVCEQCRDGEKSNS
jgi:hypothetical protein